MKLYRYGFMFHVSYIFTDIKFFFTETKSLWAVLVDYLILFDLFLVIIFQIKTKLMKKSTVRQINQTVLVFYLY